MKKTLIMICFSLIIIPFALFGADITATTIGSSKEEAEKSAYVELSKYINVSVYNAEQLKDFEYSTNNASESRTSSYLTSSIQTTFSNFINIKKEFTKIDSKYQCTATIEESTAPSYVSHLKNTINTINKLEVHYASTKSTASLEEKKDTITSIVKAYQEHDNSLAVLIALNKYGSNLPYPEKTIEIWKNEYKNLINTNIKELRDEKEVLLTLKKSIEISDRISNIDIKTEELNKDLNNFLQNKQDSSGELTIIRSQLWNDILNKIRNYKLFVGLNVGVNFVDKDILSNIEPLYKQHKTTSSSKNTDNEPYKLIDMGISLSAFKPKLNSLYFDTALKLSFSNFNYGQEIGESNYVYDIKYQMNCDLKVGYNIVFRIADDEVTFNTIGIIPYVGTNIAKDSNQLFIGSKFNLYLNLFDKDVIQGIGFEYYLLGNLSNTFKIYYDVNF